MVESLPCLTQQNDIYRPAGPQGSLAWNVLPMFVFLVVTAVPGRPTGLSMLSAEASVVLTSSMSTPQGFCDKELPKIKGHRASEGG